MSTLTVATVKSNSSSPPTFQNTSGTEIGTLCRAWVNFNGTGTVAIRAQFNVSSITDNGVGDYTVNFTTALADANYAIVVSGSNSDGSAGNGTPAPIGVRGTPATNSVRLVQWYMTATSGQSTTDGFYNNVSIFR